MRPSTVANTGSPGERLSIAVFYDPNYDTAIEVLETCRRPGEAPAYPATTCGDYVRGRFDAAFAYRQP